MKSNAHKINLISTLSVSLVSSIALSSHAANIVPEDLANDSTEPGYFQVPNDHVAMHRAVMEARKTVGRFIQALEHRQPGQQDFEVKKPFIQGNQVEHIWLSDIQFVGNRFQGRIDNEPRKIKGLRLAQLVSVNPNEITDWLYVDNGTLVGGYTVRAHYNELSQQQKQEFDRQANFKIGKQ